MAKDNPPKDDKAGASKDVDHITSRITPKQGFLAKTFNGTTMTGRANVAKATYLVVFSLIIYSKFIQPKIKAARAAAAAAAQNQCQPPQQANK